MAKVESKNGAGEGQLPEGWDWVAVHEIARVSYGKAIPKEVGDVPVIGSGGVYGQTKVALVEQPTVVIGRKGTAGSVYLTSGPSYPSDTTFFLEWKGRHDTRFVYYAMSLYRLSGDDAKTTLPSVKRPDLENLPLPWPPLDEQREIVCVLRAIQEAKEAIEKVITATRELKRSLMRHLFRHGPVLIEEAEKVPLRETELGLLPEHWKVVPLATAVRQGQGSLQTGPFGSLLHASDYVSEGIPFVMPKDLRVDGTIDLQGAARITPKDAARLKRYRTEEGDVLLGRRGELGRRGLITRPESGALCGSGCLRIRPGQLLDPQFVSFVFEMPAIRAWLGSNAIGTTMSNLSTEILERLPIPIITPEDQERIVSALVAVDSKIRAEEQRKISLQAVFNSVLAELMTGRRRVESEADPRNG